ncbi:MAG: ABC transporter ATP-binding protein [Deltaproteobacteria bacterium]|nr:ABC transporter ATP-binding protein [Deltaproteobacteria bacterium]
MAAPIIEVRNLTKVFGTVVAVDNVSFSMEEKDFLVLLGPSGCGKTTVLRMIAGLEIPTAGEIYLKGRLVYSDEKGIFVPAREREVGLVFQSYALWPHMTVSENIAFGLKVKGMKAAAIEEKTAAITAYMQLDGLRNRYPQEMSGGQQQRVALARMLVSQPDIFLMDEPLSNLDAKLRLEMRAEIKNLHIQTGATTVYVTHDQVEGQTMASQVAVINNGILEQLSSPKTIYKRPANLFVADFIGSPAINLIEGATGAIDTEEGTTVSLERDFWKAATLYKNIQSGRDIIAAIRPENIAVVPEEGFNTIPATVKTVLPSGSETVLRVNQGDLTLSVLMTREVELFPGQHINLYLPPEHLLLFDKATGQLLNLPEKTN